MHSHLPVIAVLVGSAAACAGPGAVPSDSAASPTTAPTEISSLLLQPMSALPECGPPPDPGVEEQVPGAVLPDDSVILSVGEQGELRQILGYVPLTPVQALVDFQERDDITVVQGEHEQFESEVLYETETHRGFFKAQVACATGSQFVEMLAEKGSDAAVPTPSGAATP